MKEGQPSIGGKLFTLMRVGSGTPLPNLRLSDTIFVFRVPFVFTVWTFTSSVQPSVRKSWSTGVNYRLPNLYLGGGLMKD